MAYTSTKSNQSNQSNQSNYSILSNNSKSSTSKSNQSNSQYKIRIEYVKIDGNCMLNSIIRQISNLTNEDRNISNIRKKIVDVIKNRIRYDSAYKVSVINYVNDWIQGINGLQNMTLEYTDTKKIDVYLVCIETNPTIGKNKNNNKMYWGGQLALQILCDMYSIRIGHVSYEGVPLYYIRPQIGKCQQTIYICFNGTNYNILRIVPSKISSNSQHLEDSNNSDNSDNSDTLQKQIDKELVQFVQMIKHQNNIQ